METISSKPIKVAVVEDEELIRAAVVYFLSSFEGIEVAAEASNGAEAVDLAGRAAVDVILMDLIMPVMGGIEAAKLIKAKRPEIKIIALTTSSDPIEISEGMAAGLDGYTLKKSSPAELKTAIHEALQGRRYISPRIVESLVSFNEKSDSDKDHEELSDREREVLHLIGEGLRNKEMAYRLGISVRTVEKHRESLRKKLKVDTVAELVSLKYKYKDNKVFSRKSGV